MQRVHGYGLQPSPLYALLTIREIPDHLRKGRDTMNIFSTQGQLLRLPGGRACADALRPLFRLAKQIRLRLGRQGYLLDNYLTLFLRDQRRGFPGRRPSGNRNGRRNSKAAVSGNGWRGSRTAAPSIPENTGGIRTAKKTPCLFQEKRTNSSLLLFFSGG